MSNASFQTQVRTVQGFGVPGDLYSNEPLRAEPFQLKADCTVGFMCTQVATEQGLASPGGTDVLAGILFNSKVYALFGDGSDPLNPSLVVPAYTNVELLKEGEVVIAIPAACNIGDVVVYNTTTGALATQPPTDAHLTAGYANAYGVITRFLPDAVGAQLAVAFFNMPKQVTIPA